MENIGIMQGRLLSTFKSNYQSHPIGYWQEEFFIAKDIGINSIEFIVDSYLYSNNPILNRKGIKEIEMLIEKTGIRVSSICADIFMNWPIQKIISIEEDIYLEIIKTMIKNLSILGGKDIVIPFVDNSRIKTREEENKIINFLKKLESCASKNNINICLETDLKPELFQKFLEKSNNEMVKVNYDVGNSASLGYKFSEEINLYSDKITNIHIKDRLFNGGPVFLGEGDAELKSVKEFIINSMYSGTLTFQAFRDNNPISTFINQLEFFKRL